MNKSKSYAEIATPGKYKNVANDWPELKNKQKGKIKQNVPEHDAGESPDQQLNTGGGGEVNTLSNAMERLSTGEVEQNNETPKSRDVIRAERQLRRRNEKLKRSERRDQEKLVQITAPKSQKVQLVDSSVMETYLTSRKVSPIRDRRQTKFKKRSAVKIDLIDLINTKVVTPIDRSSIQCRPTGKLPSSTQRHKGKRSEVQKKKFVSKLKRSILSARLLRRQMKANPSEIESVDVGSDVKQAEPTDKELVTSTVAATELPSNKPASVVVFSRKFRPYCDNLTSSDLLSLTEALLRDIFRFQDRAYNKNEIKARSQRRYVVGFKESMRQLDIGKVKLLVIAPDLETEGVTDVINEMKTKCQSADVPYVFALKRRQLGYVLLKKVPVSCVAVLNYQGSEENSRQLLSLIHEEKLRFQSAMSISQKS